MSTIANPADLRRRGIEVLVRDLGYADAMRFLQQFGSGRGDYTTDRAHFPFPATDDELLRQADALADEQRRRRATG